MKLKLKPVGDRIMVREANPGETMIGSIAAVQSNPTDDQIMRAEVLALGDGQIRVPNHMNAEAPLKPPCKVGSIVFVPRYQGWEVKSFYTGVTDKVRMYSFAEVLAVEET